MGSNGHGETATPDYEIRHARFPHPNPLPEGEGANERLREFHSNDAHSRRHDDGLAHLVKFALPSSVTERHSPVQYSTIKNVWLFGKHNYPPNFQFLMEVLAMKLVRVMFCCIGIGAMLAGCAGSSGPGEKQGDIYPRLVKDKNNVERWDNAAAFGPVPADKAWMGQRHCSKMDTKDAQFKAIGYHEKAMNSNGEPVPGGGFLCARK